MTTFHNFNIISSLYVLIMTFYGIPHVKRFFEKVARLQLKCAKKHYQIW